MLKAEGYQCQVDSDCTDRAGEFEGTYCHPDYRVCASTLEYCETNSECIARNQGQPFICHQDTHRCAPLQSPLCPQVHYTGTDLENDDVVIVASLQVGSQNEFMKACEESVQLAVDDFGPNFLPGIGTTSRRPVALIVCDWPPPHDEAQFIEATNHLIDNARVAGIAAPTPTNWVGAMATTTIPKATPIASPASSGDELSTLPGREDLLFRMVPPDSSVLQRTAGLVGNFFEAKLREGSTPIVPAAEPIKVAILKEATSYGDSVAQNYRNAMNFNGKTAEENYADGNFQQFDYGNPEDEAFSSNLAIALADLYAFAPHVIGLASAGVKLPDVEVQLEENWDEVTMNAPKPFVFSDGAGQQIALANLTIADPTITQRWAFITDGPVEDDPAYTRYRLHYDTKFPSTDGFENTLSAGAYDLTYMLLYAVALASVNATSPPEPAAVGKAFRALTDPEGEPIYTATDPMAGAINNALGLISQGRPVRFHGVTGQPSFNQWGDNLNGSIVIWCADAEKLPPRGNGFKFSGLTVGPDGTVTGENTCL